MKPERLDKLLAAQTPYSRKDVRGLVRQGAVRVNGEPAKAAEQKIDLERDRVLIVQHWRLPARCKCIGICPGKQGDFSKFSGRTNPVNLLKDLVSFHVQGFPVGLIVSSICRF